MENNNQNSQALRKIDAFFRTSLGYFGKEIGLNSSQSFSIDQMRTPEQEQEGKYSYRIQYGYPQSGCVSMEFEYSNSDDQFTVWEVAVYAPAAGETMMIPEASQQVEAGPITIETSFGVDMSTKKHESIKEIEENPNALAMLEIATDDLRQAEVLGRCRAAVSAESDIIPCCTSRRISKEKGKIM